jgi:hypothetical protein|tara:strand:+ start:298 stop:576 length:279 start_codon:yes stop_codon:yes gene_type:complete
MVAGLMDVFGAAAFVAGTAAYNRYLSRWSYRRILSASWFEVAADSDGGSVPLGRTASLHGRASTTRTSEHSLGCPEASGQDAPRIPSQASSR